MAIWGVQQEGTIGAAYGCVGAADVTLTSSTKVTFITTGAIVAADPGPYYPVIWLTAAILFGGTAPSALVIAFHLGSGSDVDTYTVAPALLVLSTTLLVSVVLVGANSNTAWSGAGSTINITANGTGQASTAKNVGCRAVVQLLRGLDL
ncbi:MAG TPA: hypothetical protein VGH29_20730 [Candidatus Binataceae bacterium]|jgi:hypothetical protein